MVEEVWRDILDGSYCVSNLGRVGNRRTHVVMKQCINTRGYLSIRLSCYGKQKSYTVHRLVALAFIPLPPGYEPSQLSVDHIDNDKLHNTANNLQWLPFKENYLKARLDGLYANTVGENHFKAILNEYDVRQIRSLAEDGIRCCDLACAFGVSTGAISSIINRKTWKHVQ